MERRTNSSETPHISVARRMASISISSAILFALALFATQAALAQTFTVIHTFTGGADGANPYGGVAVGPGYLYGTASAGGTGGSGGNGVVFRMTQRSGGWALTPIYEFTGGNDGSSPLSGVVVRPNHALYGTTQSGGSSGDGTVYELTPPPNAICGTATCFWKLTVLHTFAGFDGRRPQYGNLLFDQAGNIYGTAAQGGQYGNGVVYELLPSGGGWSESILYSFAGPPNDGSLPSGGLTFDPAGNLYGTTANGGSEDCHYTCGTIFELSPSGGGWTETVLHYFDSDQGFYPDSTLVMDQQGNLYGAGGQDIGVMFELTPSGGGWNFSVTYPIDCDIYGAGLTLGSDGNFYGACSTGPGANYPYGSVFKLAYSSGMWRLTILYGLNGTTDGSNPISPVAFDRNGNLYGTALLGGNTSGVCAGIGGCGTVWEIPGVIAPN